MKTFSPLSLLVFLICVGCVATPTAKTVEPTATWLPPAAQTTLVPMQTATLTVVPKATPTPNVEFSQCYISMTNQRMVFPSPSDKRQVVACQSKDLEEGWILLFLSRDDPQKWMRISVKDTFITPYRSADPKKSELLQNTMFRPIHWVPNDEFVYFVPDSLNFINDNSGLYKGFDGLFRLNLSTGKISTTLKPAIAPLVTTYSFAFSPDESKLVYMNQSILPLTIVLFDIPTGTEKRITLDRKYTDGGNLLWMWPQKQPKRFRVGVTIEHAEIPNFTLVYDTEKGAFIDEWVQCNPDGTSSAPSCGG